MYETLIETLQVVAALGCTLFVLWVVVLGVYVGERWWDLKRGERRRNRSNWRNW